MLEHVGRRVNISSNFERVNHYILTPKTAFQWRDNIMWIVIYHFSVQHENPEVRFESRYTISERIGFTRPEFPVRPVGDSAELFVQLVLWLPQGKLRNGRDIKVFANMAFIE